jgi:hypothetical protein
MHVKNVVGVGSLRHRAFAETAESAEARYPEILGRSQLKPTRGCLHQPCELSEESCIWNLPPPAAG